jgi:hypothetical protein
MQTAASMGRIVHYVSERGDEFPAIVRVTYGGVPERVTLTAFVAGGGTESILSVPHSETDEPNTWHWPERD